MSEQEQNVYYEQQQLEQKAKQKVSQEELNVSEELKAQEVFKILQQEAQQSQSESPSIASTIEYSPLLPRDLSLSLERVISNEPPTLINMGSERDIQDELDTASEIFLGKK